MDDGKQKGLNAEKTDGKIPVRSYFWLGVSAGLAFLCLAISIIRLKWLGR